MLRLKRLLTSGYSIAILASLLTLSLRFLLNPLLGERSPLLLFILPVIASAWWYGLKGGLLATGLSALLGTYFFVPPFLNLRIESIAPATNVAIFLLEGIIISYLSEALHRFRQRLEGSVLELKEQKEQYRLLVEGAKDYAIYGLDSSGHITSWNNGAEIIKGYKAAEILGRHVSIFYTEADKAQGKPEASLQTARSTGHYEEEGQRQRKDGSLFWANAVIYALRDERGNLYGFSKIARDITERKLAEEQLRRAVQRLESLRQLDREILAAVSSLAIAEVALSRLNESLPCEQAAVVLHNPETSQGTILAGEIFGNGAGSEFPLSKQKDSEVLKNQPRLLYVEDLHTLSDRSFPFEGFITDEYHSFMAVTMQTEDTLIGNLVLVATEPAAFNQEHQEIAQEIANLLAIAVQQARLREQLQEYTEELENRVAERTLALQEANDSLEAFSYSASHDLRAPLRAMHGLSTALLEDYGNQLEETAQLYAQEIATSAQQADQLIADILEYARLGRANLKIQALNLTQLVAEVLTQIEGGKQTSLAQISVENPLPNVMAQRSTLRQVILNLLTNAMKYVVPDCPPSIHIWAERRTGWVRLWIQDNGIGIAPEHQERIFQPFERLHAMETYPGTGVGLAIVRKGIEKMGGKVGVESELGQGSRFWIELREVN